MKYKKYILLSIFIIAVSFLIYCFFPVLNYEGKNEPNRILLFDRNWVKITDKANEFWYRIKLEKKEFDEIENSEFVKSLIKIEDKNYYNHFWINILAKFRAIKDNILWKKISGASTITEQFIKNKYFLWEKRTYLQKAREWFLSIFFTFKYGKSYILQEYLDNIFMWNNIYWIKTASKIYFNKNIVDLNNQEITILLSLLNYPSTKHIKENTFVKYMEKIKQRLWFSGLLIKGFNLLNEFKPLNKFPFVSPHLASPLGERNIISIDSKLQEFTKEVIKNTLDELKNENVTNSAVLAIIPKTWEILIYQGSKDFYATDIDGQVDVIKALRQPGSIMKPFLYLNALEEWYWTDDLLIDIESEYNSFKNTTKYISENYSLKEYGLVRFKKALWNSLNNATVRLAKELGLKKVYDFYKNYWFNLNESPEHYWYSLVLWNPSISLKSLVFSYSKLLNLKDKNKFLLYDILSDSDNRDISFWVNSVLNTSIPMAVKTWTSSDFRDNLVVSYHPDLVLWVWVWNNDNSSMKWVTWITWAWYIWHQIIEKTIELWYIQNRKIEIPEWIIEWNYCLDIECFRKEIIYKKQWKKYFSRILDNYFSWKDLKENISNFEKEKLQNLGFEIRE